MILVVHTVLWVSEEWMSMCVITSSLHTQYSALPDINWYCQTFTLIAVSNHMLMCVHIDHRSLTGGPRSGYGPRSHPIRTRTYSQKRRLRFKTWRRGASISTSAAFVVFTVVVVGSPTGGLRSESVKAFDIVK